MQEVVLSDIQSAMERIAPYVRRTDIADVILPTGDTLSVKAESMQATGAFKARGAFNRILRMSKEERSRGIIAASAGNHAQGVALAARTFNIPCTIYMPRTAPLSKIASVKGYGAQAVLEGEVFDDAYVAARKVADSTGAAFVHAFDDPDIIAGQGTVALEIAEQMPEIQVLLLPVGGGGLAAGIACAMKSLKPDVKIIGVEAEGAASMKASLDAGRIVTLASATTIADGIAVKTPGELTYAMCKKYLDDIVTVDEDEIANTILFLLEEAKMVSEGAGAVSIAAALYGRVPCQKGTVALLSGGNVDVTMISRIIDKGLAFAGRKILLKVIIADRPGQLAKLLALVSETGANVVAIHHDRIRTDVVIGSTMVELELETRDSDHAMDIQAHLKKLRYKIMS